MSNFFLFVVSPNDSKMLVQDVQTDEDQYDPSNDLDLLLEHMAEDIPDIDPGEGEDECDNSNDHRWDKYWTIDDGKTEILPLYRRPV